MRRFLRVRLLVVVGTLLLVPTLVMPFAERLRVEWIRYWERTAQSPETQNVNPRKPVVYRTNEQQFLEEMADIQPNCLPQAPAMDEELEIDGR